MKSDDRGSFGLNRLVQAPEERPAAGGAMAAMTAVLTQVRGILTDGTPAQKQVIIAAGVAMLLAVASLGKTWLVGHPEGAAVKTTAPAARPVPERPTPLAPTAATPSASRPEKGEPAKADAGAAPKADASAAPKAAAAPSRTEENTPLNLDPPPAAGAKTGSIARLAGWIFGMVLKLGAVLALAYGSLLLLRRYVPGAAAAAPSSDMGIKRTIVLGAGRSVHLLDVEGRHILIGATAQQITMLADLTDSVVPEGDAAVEEDEPAGPGPGTFEAHLGGLLGGASKPAAVPAAPAVPIEEAAPSALEPEVYSDDELREEMRRRLFAMNRSAAGIARLHDTQGKGEQGAWSGH